uniref:Retrotransposon gag domain-containing protein n=1 Tax=Brassica oleracea var. oleracea TaxID=109376 RepID=A0A0D3BKC3_BRAOL
MAEAIQTGVQAGVQAALAANAAEAAAPRQQQNRRHNPVFEDDGDGSDEDNPFGDNPNHQRHQQDRGQQQRNAENTRWTSGIKLDIPEYHGSSQPEELLDWFVTVDEFLEFKDVPTNKKVPLITTRFRGHAASWWNQLKLSRTRRGKEKIIVWDKLKKQMHKDHAQSRSTLMSFYQMLTRVDINDSEDQLVASLLQDYDLNYRMLHQFDPRSVSEARQRAVLVEQQNRLRNNQWAGNTKARNTTSSTEESKASTGRDTTTGPRANPRSTEPATDAVKPRPSRPNALRNCLAPKSTEAWQRISLFSSTCTVKGKICRFVIDSGCSANVVSKKAVKKVDLTTKTHPHPYRLLWMQTGAEVLVSKRTLLSLSIGSFYKDTLYCDIAPMDVSHIILGRPWQYDHEVMYNGK